MKQFYRVVSTALFSLILASCNNSDSVENTQVSEPGFTVSGVATKGPIQNATVAIFALDDNGNPAEIELSSTTTDSNGKWQISLVEAPVQASLVVVSGGSYVDEADPSTNKRTIELASDESVKGILLPGYSTASVNILTQALYKKSMYEAAESGNFYSILNNNRNSAKLALGFDPFTTVAANPLKPAQSSSVDSIEYAMYLGGVATALNSASIILGLPQPSYSVMVGMTEDMADGMLDGEYLGEPVQVSINGLTKTFPSSLNLNLAIQRFRNNNYAAYSVTSVSEVVSVNETVMAEPGTNLSPDAIDDTAVTVSGVSLPSISVLANDTDADGDSLTISSFTQPANGSVTQNSNGSFAFTPNANFVGNTLFSYTISDGRGGEDSAQVVITVGTSVNPGDNNPPSVNAGSDQIVTANQQVSLSGTASDSDGSISSITWSQISGTTVSLTTPDALSSGFTAPSVSLSEVLVFALTVVDDDGESSIDTVNVVVNPLVSSNTPPVVDAGSDQVVTSGTVVSLSGSANDSDGTVVSTNWTQISGTSATLSSPDSLNSGFTAPSVSATEVLVFSLTAVDDLGGTTVDTVNIIVTTTTIPTGNAPTADAGADATAYELTSVNLAGTGSDSDGSIASYQWSQVGGSTVTLVNSNSQNTSFTSPEVLVGNIDVLVFQLTVTDDSGLTGSDFKTVIVNPVLIAPVANAGNDQTANEDTTVDLDGSGSSDDRSIASYSWAQTSGTGTLSITNADTAAPTVSFPDVANDTAFTITLTVTDDEGGTDTDEVIVTAISLNQPPAAVDDGPYTADEEVTLTISDLLDNDSDPEGNSFSLNSVTQGTNGGTVTLIDTVSLSYTSAIDANGDDSFTYTLVDEFGAISAPATVTVSVNNVNDTPVANDDTAETVQGIPLILADLLSNDTDVDGDTLQLSGVGTTTPPAHGTVTNNLDGSITYVPELTYNGEDAFTYSIVDGNGGSATATVTVTIIPDSDGDSIIDTDEATLGTDPENADSDGDGFYDHHEIMVGTSPLLNTEMPPATLINETATGSITTDTVWTLGNSPYYVKNNLTIDGATLTIEAGVVVKFDAGIYLYLSNSGSLVTQGNIPVPQKVVFTSDQDDSINGDTDGVIETPGAGSWGGIQEYTNTTMNLSNTEIRYPTGVYVYNSNFQLSRVDIGDASGYALYLETSNTGTYTATIDQLSISDIDGDGISTRYSSLYIYKSGNGIQQLNLSNITIGDSGDTSSDSAVYMYGYSGGSISGIIDNLTINDSNGYGVYIYGYQGTIDPLFQNTTITNSGNYPFYVYNQVGDVSLSFDGSNIIDTAPSNYSGFYFIDNNPVFLDTSNTSIANTGYGLYLDNSDGEFRNITMDNLSLAGLRLYNDSYPTVFENITATNSPTPYELIGQSLDTVITAGYSFDDTVGTNYIRILGSLGADMTLTSDPLGTGSSVYYVTTDLVIPAGISLTIEDGAILKFALNLDLQVYGDLYVGDGDGIGEKAVFTSFRDDSVGAAIGDGTAAAANDWDRINLYGDGTNVLIDNAIIRYADRALYSYYVTPASLSITNTDISDIYYYGIDVQGSGTDTLLLDLDNVSMTNVGASTSYHGIYLYTVDSTSMTGTWTNVSMNNIGGNGILIDDNSTGTVAPVISGLSIGDSGTIGQYGIDIQGNATTTPTFDGSSGSGNFISGGSYNLLLRGVGGSYSDLTLDGASTAAIYLSEAVNPSTWDDNSILINNAPTPYSIATSFPSSIGVLGTADIGYNQTNSTVTESYVQTGGTISDTTYVADPLNTGNSVYYVSANITIPEGITLTVEDGAVLKFGPNFEIYVTGNLVVGDGDGSGDKAVFTSFRDNSVGADISDGTAPASTDWDQIRVYGNNSNLDIDNAEIRYSYYGLYNSGYSPVTFELTNSTISDTYYHGIYLYYDTGDTGVLDLDQVTLFNIGTYIYNGYHGIFVDINYDASFSGTWYNVTINDVHSDAILIDDDSTGTVNPLISGLTIGDSGVIGLYGVDIQGDATTTPTFDASSGSGNFISGGSYNLLLRGVGGSYSDLTLDGASAAAIYLSGAVNPSTWDDNSILINNAPTPYSIATNFPSSIGVLGTADLGYNQTSSTVTESYVQTGGTISDLTYVADPLNTGNSVYYVSADITIPEGITLTMEDGAVLKFGLNFEIYVSGNLTVGDGDGLGDKAVFTSFRDNSVGADISDGTAPAGSDWDQIRVYGNNSNLDIDNAEIRYADYGLHNSGYSPATFELTNSTISDTYYHGIYLYYDTGDTGVLDLDQVTLFNIGTYIYNGYHGIFVDINIDASFSGTWYNVTINDVDSDAILIDDDSTGTVNPLISGLTIGDSGVIGLYGVDIQGDATTTPTFDASSGSGNFISGGSYNLLLRGVGGSYSDLTLDGASTAAIYFTEDASPSTWNNVTIDNTLSPYELYAMALPSGISYTAGSAGLLENYIILSGTLASDLTLDADPLGSGHSVWYIDNTLTVNAGAVLTVTDNTVLKFADSFYFSIYGGLNVTASAGNEAIFTSILDDTVVGDSNDDGSATVPDYNSWNGIYFYAGGGGLVENMLVKHASDAVYIQDTGASASAGGLTFSNLSIDHSAEGFYVFANTATTDPIVNNLTITDPGSYGIHLRSVSGVTLDPTFNGALDISDTGSRSATCIYNDGLDPNMNLSGFTLTDCNNGIRFDSGNVGTFENSVITGSASHAVYLNSSGANSIIKNNVITNASSGNGIYCYYCQGLAYGNIIRGNASTSGGGMDIVGASITVKNNLFIDNRGTNCGSALCVSGAATSSISNNTFTSNEATTSSAVSLSINSSGALTLKDNVIYGNDSTEDVYWSASGTLTENYNLLGNVSGFTSDVTDLSEDPQFNNGFYMANVNLVDAGSDLYANLLTQGGTTIQSDGTVDINTVDLGYHFDGAAPVIDADLSTITVDNATPGTNETVTITLTIRDESGSLVKEGQDVEFVLDVTDTAGVLNGTLGSRIYYHADSTATISFTSDALSDASINTEDTITAIVNGVTLATPVTINW